MVVPPTVLTHTLLSLNTSMQQCPSLSDSSLSIGPLVTGMGEASSRPCSQRIRAGRVTKHHDFHIGHWIDCTNAAKTKGGRRHHRSLQGEQGDDFQRNAVPEQRRGVCLAQSLASSLWDISLPILERVRHRGHVLSDGWGRHICLVRGMKLSCCINKTGPRIALDNLTPQLEWVHTYTIVLFKV